MVVIWFVYDIVHTDHSLTFSGWAGFYATFIHIHTHFSVNAIEYINAHVARCTSVNIVDIMHFMGAVGTLMPLHSSCNHVLDDSLHSERLSWSAGIFLHRVPRYITNWGKGATKTSWKSGLLCTILSYRSVLYLKLWPPLKTTHGSRQPKTINLDPSSKEGWQGYGQPVLCSQHF